MGTRLIYVSGDQREVDPQILDLNEPGYMLEPHSLEVGESERE